MIIAYYLTKKLGLQPIKIHFDSEKIVFQYLSNNLGKVKKKKMISMNYIKGFSDFNFGRHQTFKLKLIYNSTFTIYKNGYWNRNDDFEILIRDFKNFIETQNSHEIADDKINNNHKIEYKDFFQTRNATILFYLSIGILILMIFKGQTKNFSSMILAIGGVLGYIGTYLIKKKRK